MKVNASKREAFLNKVQDLITHSKVEEGNISYHLYEDTITANTFVMVEEWKDQDAMKLHESSVHFQSFIQASKDLFTEPMQAKIFNATKL